MQEMEKAAERAMINDVCVFGANLLHPKMLEVIKYALVREPDENLQAIFISPLGPRNRVGQYHHFTRSFVLSLPQIMDDAVNVLGTDEDIGLSVSAHMWVGMIYTIFHEMHHNVALATELGTDGDYTKLDDEWHETEDKLACEYAEEHVEDAIINCNAEVPKDIMDIPWMGERVMDFLVSELKDDPDWVRTIKDRLDQGIVFESKGDIYDSLVEYFKANTDHPEKYEKENQGAATEMVPETPSLFDKKILPGEQRELFPNNLGGSVSPPMSEGETEEITRLTEELVLQKGKEPMHEDVHDHMPDEATMDPDECGSISNDPFAPNFADETPAGEQPAQTNDPSSCENPCAGITAAAIQTGAKDILLGLYMRLYQHMFTSDVFNPMILTDAEKTLGLVVGCNTWNGQQSICVDVRLAGQITGCKYKNGTLPAYDLILNWGGQARRIKMLAQNPDKQSTYAARARAGEKIAWLIEVIPGNTQGVFVAKIENGVYSLCERR